MNHTKKVKNRTALGMTLAATCFAMATPVAIGAGYVGPIMCACPGKHKPLGNDATCEDACFGRRSSPGGGHSSSAQRAQEAAAAAAAERQRQAEAERIERERLAEEKRIRDAEFILDRDAAVSTLKGSVGTSAYPNSGGLKGTSGYGLRDAVSDRGLKGSTTPSAEQSKQAAAWKQLRCAASITKYALNALQIGGNVTEFGYLKTEALKALDGERTHVVCEAAPQVSNVVGKPVDMEQVKGTERKVLERAEIIAQRMSRSETRNADARIPVPAPSDETETEKMRRVQRELNSVNSQKLTGKTKSELDQQEKDRKDLAKLVLVNNGIEKGDFTADISIAAPRKPGEKRQPPAPKP